MRKKVLSIIAVLCLMVCTAVSLTAESDTGTVYDLVNGYLSVSKSAPGHDIYCDVALFDGSGAFLTYSNAGNYGYVFCDCQHRDAYSGTWYWEVYD